jgi:hypothetical protein
LKTTNTGCRVGSDSKPCHRSAEFIFEACPPPFNSLSRGYPFCHPKSSVLLLTAAARVTYEILDVVHHPSYPGARRKDSGDALDMALVRVRSRVSRTFAHMPDASSHELKLGSRVQLYGHGHTGAVDGRYRSDRLLRTAEFEVVGRSESAKYDLMQLKGANGARTCGDDSGSPYLQKQNNRVVQVGVHHGGAHLSLQQLDELLRLLQKQNLDSEEAEQLRAIKSLKEAKMLESQSTQCTDYAMGNTLSTTAVRWIQQQLALWAKD